MHLPRRLFVALLPFAICPDPGLVAQARHAAILDPQLGSPDGAEVAAGGARVLTWVHASPTRRGSLVLWDVAERRQLAAWSFGPRADRDPGTADLDGYLVGRSTVALHPRGSRALLVRASSEDRDTGLFELDLTDPESVPRLRWRGLPRAVTWSRDGRHVLWVERGGSLVLAEYVEDGEWATVVRHPLDDEVGTFSHPGPTTLRWDQPTGTSWTLDLDDLRAPPVRSRDRQWIGRLADGSEVSLDERHVLRTPTRVWVDHGFDPAALDFRGPPLVGAAASGDRVAWIDGVTRRLHVASSAGPASIVLEVEATRWVCGLGDGGFLAATDQPGLCWIRGDAYERLPHPGGMLDQLAWSPDGNHLGVAGGAGLAVFDVQGAARTPIRTRPGRHSVGPGLTGAELCVASAAGLRLMHAATGQTVGVATRAVHTGESVSPAPRRRPALPELLAHVDGRSSDSQRQPRDEPPRLRLFPFDADHVAVGFAVNRMLLVDPRTGSTETKSWPTWPDTLLEGLPLAVFHEEQRTLVVTVTPRPEQPSTWRRTVFHQTASSFDGNVVALDRDGRPVRVRRLDAGPTAALRERVSGDLLVTFGIGGLWRGLAQLDADSLEPTVRYLPESPLLGLAQIADDAVLTWDEQSLIRFDLRLCDAREVELPGSVFHQPRVRAVAVAPDGERTAVLFDDAVVVVETARLR